MNAFIKWGVPLLGIALSALLVSFGVYAIHQNGYDVGFGAAQAVGNKNLSDYREQVDGQKLLAATQKAEAMEAAAKALALEVTRGNSLAAQLAATNAELRNNTDKLNGEIKRVTTLYRRALDAQPEPLPVALFTFGFVRVWNGALSADPMFSGQPTSDADAPSLRSGAADQLVSGVTPADLLTNHVRNSEKHASCRAQLKSLIEWNTNGRT